MSNNTSKALCTAREALVSRLYSVFALLMSVIATVLYLSGVVVYYGKAIGVVSSVEFILAIFNMENSFYRILCGAGVSVLYIIFGVAVIKNLIHSIVLFFKNVCSKKRAHEDVIRDTFQIGQDAISSFFKAAVMIFVCGWVNTFHLSEGAKYVFILGILTLVVNHLVYYFIQGQTIPSTLMHTGFFVVSIVCAITLALGMRGSYISDAISSLVIFFSGIESVAVENIISINTNIAASVIMIIIACKALGIFSLANEYNSMMTREIRGKSRGLLITIGVLITIDFTAFVIGGADIDVDSIITFLDPYIPMILASVALLVSVYVDPDVKKRERKVVSDDENVDNGSYLTKKGVLRIKAGTTEIEKKQFADRREITAVVIPSTVTSVGKQAFFGCGGITAIYCEASGRPDAWDPEWNEGCYATVHWGADISKTI